ncbi:beta-1,4-glucuronyltransferase 1-like [Photinus pyralis]|nr:beta-1,4-glucuronyltransferase 1-like [Photinus pyralis]
MKLTWFSVRNCLLLFIACLAVLAISINIITSTRWANFRQSEIFKLPAPAERIRTTTSTAAPRKENLIQEITGCYDRVLEPSIEQRGEYWVLFNYVPARQRYRCYESITYTTQGDYTFLDNLIPLVERWNGPISVALHAPGYDFSNTVDSIAYLRHCLKASDLIKKYVTFHIFFSTSHIPFYTASKPPSFTLRNSYKDHFDCYKTAPYANKDFKALYKTKANLTYPINVARNIAKRSAQTHFVLASDIELYPSPNLIPKFLRFVEENRKLIERKTKKVFVLPVFEVLLNQTLPSNKTALQKMFNAKRAFYFHKRICSLCHTIPNEKKWISSKEDSKLNIFTSTKRQGKYRKWEAFYIGTHSDPIFDERFSWEGQSNKMVQGYAMCLMNYDYLVLDNAFLTHKPGVKKQRIQLIKFRSMVYKTQQIIRKYVKPQLQYMFGRNDNCYL